MKSPSKSIPASILGYVILTVILTAGAAQSLTGTNTVDSGDIIDGTVKNIDIKPSTITGSRILDNSVGAADLAANAVGNAEMADNAIGNAEVADNAIGMVELLDNAIGNSEMADDAIGAAEVTNKSLTLDDFATAEAADVTTSIAINANDCVTVQTGGLSGATVGDLAVVVLRSATDGTFWEGGRVTTAGQFPLRVCNTTATNFTLGSPASSTIDVFTVRP